MPPREPSYIANMQNEALRDSDLWFPALRHDVLHTTLGLCGEVGEFANIMKKIQRGDSSLTDAVTRNKATSELADIFTYTLVLSGQMGVDLERLYYTKRAFNQGRFGQK